jgi:transcriptional regulator with XRE-family HTH domain
MRRERGMTLDELAEAADVSPSHLSRLERSQTLPSFPVLAKIAEALDADVNEFERLEQDVAKLEPELSHFLELLAIGPQERAELLNLSIEARRCLVDRLRSLSDGSLTPFTVQDRIVQLVLERGGLDGLTAAARIIRDAGMTGVGYSRGLMRLDQTPGQRDVLIGGASLMPLAPGVDLFQPYRSAFGEEALDPAVSHWWSNPPEDLMKRGTADRPVRVVVGTAALESHLGLPIARCLLDALDRGGHARVAVTDRELSSVNVGVVNRQFGMLEQLPRSNGRQAAKRAAIWLSGPDRVQPFVELIDGIWNDLGDDAEDQGRARERLRSVIE